ncbi:MAG: hypothetical protein H6811_08650 [Phycisphaeraceae bacterium]|nr:hypothetical protein [Phycisphaeraceae bacterium]
MFGIGVSLWILTGCAGSNRADQSTGPNRGSDVQGTSLREQSAEIFQTQGSDSSDAQTQEASHWAIVVALFKNDASGRAQATDALPKLRGKGKLRDAYLQDRGSTVAIAVGRFSGANDSKATRELERIRETTVDGVKPYGAAILAPPVAPEVSSSPYDLGRVRRERGPDALYTLQIGLYGRTDAGQTPEASELAEYRRLAEEAVEQLRRDGEEAFFYHGPSRSTVTVGVFGPQDHAPGGAIGDSLRLRQARERFPHNLLNGKGITERYPTESGRTAERLQPSRLIAIPG